MTTKGEHMRVASMLLACAITAPASAQRVAGDDDPIVNSAAPVTDGIGSVLGNGLGVLAKGFGITAQVQTIYDGNIRRIGRDQVGPNEGLSDIRVSPSVIVSNVTSVGRQELYVEGEYGRDFYLRGRLPDRDRYGVAGGVRARAGNFCTGSVDGFFRSRQLLISDAAITTQSNLIETTSVSARANCQRPVGIGFGVNASHDVQNNKDPLRNAFDSRSNSIGANLSYTLPVLGTLSVGGNYSDIDYPSRTTIVGTPAAPTASGDGVSIYSGNVGYRRAFGPRITVNVGGSYYVASPKPRSVLIQPFPPLPLFIPQDREKFSGAGYNFGLAYRPGARLTFDLSAARDISQSSNVGALFIVRDSFGIDASYSLGPSITTGLGATYDIRRYRNPFASAVETVPRIRDNISRVYARVSYAPRRLFDVDFEVAHQRRNSNPSLFDFASTSAALTLRVKFGRN